MMYISITVEEALEIVRTVVENDMGKRYPRLSGLNCGVEFAGWKLNKDWGDASIALPDELDGSELLFTFKN